VSSLRYSLAECQCESQRSTKSEKVPAGRKSGLSDAGVVVTDELCEICPSLKPAVWFDSRAPLRSGWAWGQHYLAGGTAAVEAPLGNGKVIRFGPEITFRAQPHGTVKFLAGTRSAEDQIRFNLNTFIDASVADCRGGQIPLKWSGSQQLSTAGQ